MLPKMGKRFPNRDGKGSAGLSYPRAIAAALRGELVSGLQVDNGGAPFAGDRTLFATLSPGGTRGRKRATGPIASAKIERVQQPDCRSSARVRAFAEPSLS